MDSSEGSTQVSQAMVPPSMTSGPKEPLQNSPIGKTESTPMTLSDLNLPLCIDSSDSEDLSSYSEEDSPSPQRLSNSLPPKRRRSQPVKFEPGPIGPKKHIGGKSPNSVPYKKKSKNGVPRSCGQCEGCLRDECGKCVFCKDKPKYGGPNKRRQRCIHRTCTNKDGNKCLQSQQQVNPPKAASAVKMVTAKVAAKRSSNVQLISSSSAKKAKMVSKPVSQSSKSVSFNLKDKVYWPCHSSSPSGSNVLPLITTMSQSPKTSLEPVTITLPSNVPTDVRQWTVNHVVQYFKSMADCCNFADLFEAQEADGIALLLLTHETLVKCLGVKLGLALKIMQRVEELKRFQNQNRSTK